MIIKYLFCSRIFKILLSVYYTIFNKKYEEEQSLAGFEQDSMGLEQGFKGFEQGSANYLGWSRILRG